MVPTYWDKYRLVLFDFDETLMATAKTRWDALIATGQHFGIEIDEEKIRLYWGRPFDRLITSLFPEVDLETFVANYQDTMFHFVPAANPGASELLQWLSEHGKRLEILTSSREDLIRQDLREADFERYFAKVWDHLRTDPYHKPDRHVFDSLVSGWRDEHLDLEQVVYVGDSVRDYLAASSNAIDFLGVTTGLDTEEEFVSAGLPSACVFASLLQLVPTAL